VCVWCDCRQSYLIHGRQRFFFLFTILAKPLLGANTDFFFSTVKFFVRTKTKHVRYVRNGECRGKSFSRCACRSCTRGTRRVRIDITSPRSFVFVSFSVRSVFNRSPDVRRALRFSYVHVRTLHTYGDVRNEQPGGRRHNTRVHSSTRLGNAS